MAKVIEQMLYDDDNLLRAGAALMLFERYVEQWRADDAALLGFSVRVPQDQTEEYFMVMRFRSGDEKMVAFRDGDQLWDLIVGAVKALKSGKLKLRADKYGDR